MKNEVKVRLFDDKDGRLLPVEFSSIKFIPKRVFVVDGVPKDVIRGNHAHYETEQLLVCVRGEILVVLNDGNSETETLIKEGETIYIGKMIWDYQKFLTGNDVMIVLCSTSYDKKDYIEDINEFYKIVRIQT
jgi:dTDP-4-dehydrorhamnose 3,5-epimerase-like enzyme